MKKNIAGIFVCTLLIVTMTIQTVAIDIDNNKLNTEQVFGNGPHTPGDLREEYNLLSSDLFKPIFSEEHTTTPASYSDDIADLIEQINESMIYSYIENLTSFGPRVTTTQACEDAGFYLYNEFMNMGLDVRYQNWSFSADYYGSNIEATLNGSDSESDCILIVCAHYDSVPGAPGADDDASGVATVLAAANIMSQYSFNHTVRFVTFPGEEQGLFGSYYYAEEAYRNGDHIVSVLNADAFAYATNEDNASKVTIYQNAESAWLATYSADIAQIYNEEIDLEVIPSNFTQALSDHARFWQFGYEAVWYSGFEYNPNIHTSNDVIENCNITYATRVSKLILATLADLAQSYQGETPVDMPTWEEGDEWTYRMDFYADFGSVSKEITYGTADNLVYTIVDETEEEYILEFSGRYQGWIKTTFATIRISRLTKLTGDLIIQKSDFSVKKYSIRINGISFLMLGNILIPLPIPLQMGIDVNITPALYILPFPLYEGKHGVMPASKLEHFGFINLMSGLLYKFEREWEWSTAYYTYRCDKELISVDSGTFDAYRITSGTLSQKIENYYAPEMGNIVKQTIWVNKDFFPYEPGIEIKQELISTTFEP